jgi:NAD(P)-dependent dehydrogenase (short-subunit alcohol dehydrogenase family)
MMTWSHVLKSVIATGVTPGSLGADTVRALTLHDPLLLILASRSTEKISQVIADISIKSSTIVKALELDLASLPSVRAAAGKVLEWTTSVDAVIETVGVMAVPTYQVNDDGLEMTFAVNHLRHFLFTNLLMERLLAAKDGGVVVPFTSEAHKRASLNVEDVNFDVSPALLNTRGLNVKSSRTGRIITNGGPIDNRRRQIFCSPLALRNGLGQRV